MNNMNNMNNIDNQNVSKQIEIKGQKTKNVLNKIAGVKIPQKRVVSQTWNFPDEYYEYENQIKILNDISVNCHLTEEMINENICITDTHKKVIQIACQQIHRKISGYKQQDIFKKRLDEKTFLTFDSVIQEMKKCLLKCRYCNGEMNILYNISREMKQWSVDRVDNDIGHNIGNFHLACLECNLHRRRRTDEKYLFTKQLNIVKNS